MPQNPIVTFTTDFGVNDHFVGTMRGVILNINPATQLVDICNNVQSFDVLDGAMTIAAAYRYYPAGTIHMVIVDPGVGTSRRPIVAVTEKHIFIAPDNGVLSLVFDKEERLSVRHIDASHYYLEPVSQTFHGRDVFAPIAGWLAKGVDVAKLGEEITDFARFAMPKPKEVAPKTFKGVVIKTDKFGNLITNFTAEDCPALFAEGVPEFKLRIGQAEVSRIVNAYAEGGAGELFAIRGSMGYLEIATNRGVAAQLAQAARGAEVQITLP